MKYKRLLLTINICLCSFFSAHRMYSQTPYEGVSFWAIAGPNHSIINNGDFFDEPFGSMVLPKPGWHLGFSSYVPFTFKIPQTSSKLLLCMNFGLTQINYQYDKDLSETHYKSNSNIYTANIGLGKYFRFSDKLGIRFSIHQALYTYKMNQDLIEKRVFGSNKWDISSVFNIKNKIVTFGMSGFIGPLFIFDKYYDTWCIGKLNGGKCLENKFRALQLDVGIQLWKSKK